MENLIKNNPIIAILRNTPDDILLDYAKSLYNGGLRAFEISYTTKNAASQIRAIKANLPKDILIGAGTILTLKDTLSAQDAGVDFMLSPATNIEILEFCADNHIDFLPGVFTPTDVSICLKYGFSTMKLFPANSLPLNYAKNLQGPFPHTNYVAVGGISPTNTAAYLKNGYCGVGIGSSLVDNHDFEHQNWDTITNNIHSFIDSLKKEDLL
jgi:Entner-Doudoroff aldolase